MTASDAYAWLALNPRPVIEPDEGPIEYGTRLENWIFYYSLACEGIHDEKHDQKGWPANERRLT